MTIQIDGHWFIDEKGRRVLLRGVNLGGSSKVPRIPDGATHIPTDYRDHRSVSFVGRPFPLAEADEHYRRLRHWGFNCLRFLTTWEAIEHQGPGIYDEEYLEYLHTVVKKAGEYGFYVFIDPHQDVWSRMSGGDGAPGWTLELAGFDLARIDASEAAITMAGRHPNYPSMVWSSNRYRLAAATMFTLFFGGDRFAPKVKVDGEGIQSYLQRHFIAAMQKVASCLADLPHVIGYDSLNEPGAGYIGLERLGNLLPVANAPMMTGLESLFIPAGFTREVPFAVYEDMQLRETGQVTLNPQKVSAWRSPEADIWRNHGVWDVDETGEPRLRCRDYFSSNHFFDEYLRPFIHKYAEAIRQAHPGAIIFIEGEPESTEPMSPIEGVPVVNASHWYDIMTLVTKHYDPAAAQGWGSLEQVRGIDQVHDFYRQQIASICRMSDELLGGVPTLIGEFGLPFDLDGGLAFRTGDFSPHIEALSAYYDAIDANLAHSTLWNYTPDNSNQWGDLWNQEDLSIFSRDQQTKIENGDDLDSGGRAIPGFCRPHLVACGGTPLQQTFDHMTGAFLLEIVVEPGDHLTTEIFVPRIHYPGEVEVFVSSGYVDYNREDQCLIWDHLEPGRQTLSLARQSDSAGSSHP